MKIRSRKSQISVGHRRTGFTLIELAVVLFVVGMLLVGLLGPLSTQVESRERQQTQLQLEEIKEALYGFAVANGRLPCPDVTASNDGVEDRIGVAGSQTCSAAEGNLPWVTLGVTELDAWGRRFSYRVSYYTTAATYPFSDDSSMGTVAPPPTCTAVPGQASFGLCTDGGITIEDKGSTCPNTAPHTTTAPAAVATNIPAVVLSQGKKNVGLEPLSCYEQENTDNDSTFVYKIFSAHAADSADATANLYYDDLLVWISPNILKNRMVTAGRLP